MPALRITHAAHSAVIKTPDFPQDSSPRLGDEKVTHMSKFLPLLRLERKAIFLDRLNETMTAVSSEKSGEKKTKRKQSREWNEEEGRRGKRATVSAYIFFFFSCFHPMSQHQTLTLLSKAGGSIDSIFSSPCCCDPETALWLDLGVRGENDGGDIKRERVVDSFLPFFLYDKTALHRNAFPEAHGVVWSVSHVHMQHWHQNPNNYDWRKPFHIFGNGTVFISEIISVQRNKGRNGRMAWQYRRSSIMWITAAGPTQTHLSYSVRFPAILQTDNQRSLGLGNEDHLRWQQGPQFH